MHIDIFLNSRAAGAVGGSVAWGHGASQIGVTDFASLFFTHLNVSLRAISTPSAQRL